MQESKNQQKSLLRTALKVAPTTRAGPSRLPLLFLVIGGALATLYAVVVPPFEVVDEDRHFWRAYSVSNFELRARPATEIPASFMRFHQRFPPTLQRVPGKRSISRDEVVAWLRQPLDRHSTTAVENPVANLYSFVPYVPAALVLWLGRSLDLSPMVQFYAARAINALVYVLMVYLALRILPDFRLVLFMISLTPMSLNLAASFSADCVTLGLAAVVIALVFKLAFDEAIRSISRKDAALVLATLMLLTLCKFNVWISIFALLIPVSKFGSWKRAAGFFPGCFGVCCATGLAWQKVNATAVSVYTGYRAVAGAVIVENAAFLRHHPLEFLSSIAATCYSLSLAWVWGFVGVFGWVTIPLPGPLVATYVVLLLLASLQSMQVRVSPWQRTILGIGVTLTVISIHVLLWVFQAHATLVKHAVSEPVLVPGIQGRYFLSIGLPALTLIANRRFNPSHRLQIGIIGAVVVINLLGLVTMCQVYY
jgi:uncharacterized membrane protein